MRVGGGPMRALAFSTWVLRVLHVARRLAAGLRGMRRGGRPVLLSIGSRVQGVRRRCSIIMSRSSWGMARKGGIGVAVDILRCCVLVLMFGC